MVAAPPDQEQAGNFTIDTSPNLAKYCLQRVLDLPIMTSATSPLIKYQSSSGGEGKIPGKGVARGFKYRYIPENVRGLLRVRTWTISPSKPG
jgi:hypothetical protein